MEGNFREQILDEQILWEQILGEEIWGVKFLGGIFVKFPSGKKRILGSKKMFCRGKIWGAKFLGKFLVEKFGKSFGM